MSDIVELRPGQKINLVVTGTTSTPLGQRTHETTEVLTYEQILARFKSNTKDRRIQRVPTEAREFNRFASLGQRAIETGTWANGAQVDRNNIASTLVSKVTSFPETLFSYVTDKAKKHLEDISTNKLLKPEQKKEIKDFLVKVSKPVEETA